MSIKFRSNENVTITIEKENYKIVIGPVINRMKICKSYYQLIPKQPISIYDFIAICKTHMCKCNGDQDIDTVIIFKSNYKTAKNIFNIDYVSEILDKAVYLSEHELLDDLDFMNNEKLQKLLFVDGVELITSIRNNMKNSLMLMSDKILLRKRSVIETVNDELKNICQVEHSRHRSVGNFITNLIAGIIAYHFLPKKPSIRFETLKTNQLAIF